MYWNVICFLPLLGDVVVKAPLRLDGWILTRALCSCLLKQTNVFAPGFIYLPTTYAGWLATMLFVFSKIKPVSSCSCLRNAGAIYCYFLSTRYMLSTEEVLSLSSSLLFTLILWKCETRSRFKKRGVCNGLPREKQILLEDPNSNRNSFSLHSHKES